MTLNQRILDWIFISLEKYPWLTIKYEFNNRKNIHYLNVLPAAEINISEEYCKDENDFSLAMEYLYPNDTVLFSTEDSIFPASSDAMIYSNNLVMKYKCDPIQCFTPYSYSNDSLSGIITDNPVYSLAA